MDEFMTDNMDAEIQLNVIIYYLGTWDERKKIYLRELILGGWSGQTKNYGWSYH